MTPAVVAEHVERRAAGGELGGEAAHRLEAREIELHRLDAGPWLDGVDRGGRFTRFPEIAAGEDHCGAPAGEAERGLVADPAVATRDDDIHAREVGRVFERPARAARHEPTRP